MIVRRAAILAIAFALGATGAQGAPAVEVDPHELYDRTREYLADGELRGAASALARLGTLIAKRPDWDPEGVFANKLLPPLQARLNRLQGVARRLDDFTVKALEDLQPPDIKKDISTVRDYTDWATSVIQRLRAERDRIIAGALADPEERAFLTRTEAYERTDRLLQVDVLKRMADTAGDDILGLLAGDPGMESVLVRFRQIKRDLMQIVAERDRLAEAVQKSREHREAVLGVLAGVVTDGATPKAGAGNRGPVSVGDRFARFLDGELEALRGRSEATPEERDLLRADVERYRRYNEALRAARLGPDQADRIEALSRAVEDLRVEHGVFAAWPFAGPASLVLIGALVLSAGALGWLAIERGRRLASLQGPAARRVAMVAAEAPEPDVDSKAV